MITLLRSIGAPLRGKPIYFYGKIARQPHQGKPLLKVSLIALEPQASWLTKSIKGSEIIRIMLLSNHTAKRNSIESRINIIILGAYPQYAPSPSSVANDVCQH
jgi:hypothetical protein